MAQTFDTSKFSKAVKTKRVVELGITLRKAAKQSKTSFATLSRMENEYVPELVSFIKVCNWLNIPAGEFITTNNKK